MSKFNPEDTNDWMNQDTDTSIEAIDAKLYGKVDLPSSGREVAKPVSIFAIWPDATQPRRTIPLQARADTGWNGDPAGVLDAFHVWQGMAERALSRVLETEGIEYQPFDIKKILKGQQSVYNYRDEEGNSIPLPPVTDKFIKVLQLASSIYKDKLINAINIAPRGDTYVIESGERRWLAHHVLNHYIGEKYEKIKSVQVEMNVWRQAAENNNRDDLTAIQMARQLAVLIMDMYEGDDGVDFYAPDYFDTEQEYYAQVANGYTWKIKDGFADRVQAAMGLSSYRMVSAYRNLLKIPNDLWVQADLEDWSEGAIRNHMTSLKQPEKTGESLPIGKHSDNESPSTPSVETGDKSTWSSYVWVNKPAWVGSIRGKVTKAVQPQTVEILFEEYDAQGIRLSTREMPMHVGMLEHNPPDEWEAWASAQWLQKWVAVNGRKAWLTAVLGPDIAEGMYDSGEPLIVHTSGVSEWEEPEERDADNVDTPQRSVMDKHGDPLMVGQTVKLRGGAIGTVSEIKGTLVNVDVPENPYMGNAQYGENLEIVKPDELDAEENDDSANVESEKGTSSAERLWAGKNVIWDGMRAFCNGEDLTTEMAHIIFHDTKAERDVPFSELSPDSIPANRPAENVVPSKRETLSHLPPLEDEGVDVSGVDDDALVLSNHNPYRKVLAFYQQQAVESHHVLHQEDRKAAVQLERKIKTLLSAEYADYDAETLGDLLHEVYSGIENLQAAILANIGEHFQIQVQEFGEVH